jgi:CYTH domain-containing protein
MKYAVVERERRFLTGPVDLSGAMRVLRIEDRYLDGTRLRLRTTYELGQEPVRKLGQKIRPSPDDSGMLAHTTMYLDEAEYSLLSTMAGATLTKTRHLMPVSDGLHAAVDVFDGRLSGLTMAEIDLGPSGSLSEPLPAWLGVEVTGHDRFSGHALARLSSDELATLLAAVDR